MNRLVRVAAVLWLALILFAVTAQAAAPIMPLSEVRPGMHGIGRTVVRGTDIVDFDVDVIGVLPSGGPDGDLILVRVSGPVIDATGGIAAGMSGSPVIVDGKVVGAISYGFSFADNRVGFVTPIEQMLSVLQMTAKGNGSPQKETAEALPGGLPEVIRLATPVMVSGVGARGMARLDGVLRPLGLIPVPAGGAVSGQATGSDAPGTLEPGAAFGAQLVSGDVNLTAIGTVTYVDGDSFVGFGHPFMNKGPVNMAVTRAQILETVKSVEAPFKIGTALEEVGTLTQDRPSAVGGKLGPRAATVPLKVNVSDENLGHDSTFQVKVVKDEALTLDLLVVAALQGLDKGLSRIGQGTSDVTMTLRGAGIPGGEVTRTNKFFHPADISAASLRDFMEGARLLLTNKFKAIDLEQATINVKVGTERKTGEIERAEPERPVVKPGESVGVVVTIRPYRRDQEKFTLTLPIPKEVPTGTVRVIVHGGGRSMAEVEQEGEQQEQDGDRNRKEGTVADRPKTGAENLDKLIQDFLKKDKNNDLVVEFLPGVGAEDAEGQEAVPAFKVPAAALKAPHPTMGTATKLGDPVRATLTLPFVLEGTADFELTIVDDNPKPKAKPAATPPESRSRRRDA